MDTTLGELTNDMGKQNVKMHFKIDEVSGESAHTKFTGHELTRDYLRSLVKGRQVSSSQVSLYADKRRLQDSP